MNLTKHIISVCSLLVVGLSACSDDPMDSYAPVESGDAVKFSAFSGTTSRTVYDDENIFQINWEKQDQIKIYSNKAFKGISFADYKVTPIESNGEGTNKLYNTGTIDAIGSNQLLWADNNAHNFIGVYPNSAGIEVDTDQGLVTFPINRNQQCKAVKVAEDPYYNNEVYKKYTYYAKPDMNNAFLTAFRTITPGDAAKEDGHVFLQFKPVMTTLEVVVKGPSKANEMVKVTGVSIARRLPRNPNIKHGTFVWNAKKGQLAVTIPEDSQLPDVTQTEKWNVENTLVALQEPIVLKTNESIVFTAFVPPVRIGGKLAIKVRVHATGSTEVVTNILENPIAPSNKRRITLANFPETTTGNNWITPLDDNIYINQLSIPGSHDATTGETMATGIGKGFAKTQELSIGNQWNLGVRCFDMRVAIYTGGAKPELWFYHGPTRVKVGWQKVMDDIKSQLKAHPGEFAIFLLRHENEGALQKDEDPTHFDNMLTAWLDQPENKDLFINWKPDLTIGECRGKILLVSRFNGSWTQGAYLTWPDNTIGESTIYSTGDRNISGSLIVQDYYKSTGDPDIGIMHHEKALENKYNKIVEMLGLSETAYIKGQQVSLINHVSGYPYTTSSDRYAENAEYQNPKVYEYLKTRSKQAPTGIMLCDYSGANTIQFWGTRYVSGDVLLQEIINTNYKYNMHRKGETTTTTN